MQNEIMNSTNLLDKDGNLVQKGWGRSTLLKYHRNQVEAAKFKIKEWDYYAVLNDKFGIALTVADNGYVGLGIITVFDFTVPKEWTKQVLVPFPLGKFNMPESPETGDVVFDNKDFLITFKKKEKMRRLEVRIKDFHQGKSLEANIELQEINRDSLMIATLFHKPKKFYYNHKINNLLPKGTMKIGDRVFDFESEPSNGVLDWGRGVWTYNNTWYWGSASGLVDNIPFGFNIGYGFGDTSKATENIVFYDGIGHKLDEVEFRIPDNYTDPWQFTSNDGRFEINFAPVIDRNSNTKVLFIESDQHQVFGHFSGQIVLDNGAIVNVDRVFGFAEKVMNKW
ncbi:MAG: DUF2804 domain-containing protein [Clostridium sp.]|nr:DUF2804 domain-containing protein [Clostridium sp.]